MNTIINCRFISSCTKYMYTAMLSVTLKIIVSTFINNKKSTNNKGILKNYKSVSSIFFFKSSLAIYPVSLCTISPFLKKIKVGTEVTPY